MGEKGGKTTLGVEALIASRRGAWPSNSPVAWFSPTKEDLQDFRRALKLQIDPIIRRQVNSRRIELINGNFVDFYSFDELPKAFPQYGLIVIDDARRVDGLMQLLDDTLLETVRERAGQVWILSDAYGVKNDFYRLFRRALGTGDWSCWLFDSWCNPHLPPEIDDEAATVGDLERRQRFYGEFLENTVELSDTQRIIGAHETFLSWCDRLENEGLKVDGHPFTLSDRPAMRFIYEMIPTEVEDGFDRTDVIMKCTQVGFTVMEMLAMIYMSIKFAPAKIGMFMPSTMLAAGKSSERFMPIVRTIPLVYAMMTDKEAVGSKGGEGNVLIRNVGTSKFHFLWTSGKTSTESNPMDVISFDEVQEMTIADMEKTRERMSASRIRYTLMGSTANWPDSDIHWWYKRGTQHQFHTKCPQCNLGQVLDEHFPQCIGYDENFPRRVKRKGAAAQFGEYRYRCHSCLGWIDDPQVGDWLPKDPEADIRSVHFPQFLSPTISPRDIIEAYHNADDMKNFFNRKLGKPYTDPTQVPVNLEMLNLCAKVGMEAGLQWERSGSNTFMGIDQMGFFNVAIIKKRMPDGRQAVVHLEYIYDSDPFDRCSALMDIYSVQCCVVETLPNYNDAKRFAQRHSGRVFLAGYGTLTDEMLRWGDAPKLDASDRRTSEGERDRYTVTLDQYKCMQVSMKRFQNTTCLFPDPDGLVQMVVEKGEKKMMAVCKEMAFFHFTRTALIAEKDEEEKKYRRRVVKVGIDPHTSYANMLCDVAWARAFGTSTFILPDASGPQQGPTAPNVGRVPGTASALMEQINSLQDDTCGSCSNCNLQSNYCSELHANVKPNDPGCWGYIARG
jgi:hypothetical protein